MPKPRATPAPLAFERPLTTVDLVIFTVIDGSLAVLLVRRGAEPGEPFPGLWALPGGFVDVGRDRDLESCARRKLAEKTGLAGPYLEQLGSWGGAERDPRGWSATHVYFALVPAAAVTLRAGANALDVGWFAIEGEGVGKRLAFDHRRILAAAVDRLRSKAEYTSLPVHLLPEEFTLTDLQRAYEAVIGRPLEKSAFRTRVLAAGFIEPTGGTRGGSNRPAQLHRLQRDRALIYFPRTFEPRGAGRGGH
jgi:8-oxo-dGTP diphosphatase